MRPIPPASGAANPVDPFTLAMDAILGHAAYGSSWDSNQEVWYFRMPAGAMPFVQPANSGNTDLANADLGGGTITPAAREVMMEKANMDLRHASTEAKWGSYAGRRGRAFVGDSRKGGPPRRLHSGGIQRQMVTLVKGLAQTPQETGQFAQPSTGLDTRSAPEAVPCSRQAATLPRAS